MEFVDQWILCEHCESMRMPKVGGEIDLKRLFHDLRERKVNPLDDGRVEGYVSVVDHAERKRNTSEKC